MNILSCNDIQMSILDSEFFKTLFSREVNIVDNNHQSILMIIC